MSQIFISYSHNDKEFADELIEKIQENPEFLCWIDNDPEKLPFGTDWREKIDRAIYNAFALVVIITAKAMKSNYVVYEFGFAMGADVEVIPVILERTKMQSRLAALQGIDFTAPEKDWNKLARALERAKDIHALKSLHGGTWSSNDTLDHIRNAVSQLKDKNPDVRKVSIRSLRSIGNPIANKFLLEALNDSVREVRIEAAIAISDLNAVSGLIEALYEDNENVNNQAIAALSAIGVASIGSLLPLLYQDNKRIRKNAINILGRIRSPGTVHELIIILQDNDDEVRKQAALALGQIGTPAVSSLLGTLKDKNKQARADATFALGMIKGGGERVVLGLCEALTDKQEDVEVRYSAARSLGQIGLPEAIPKLLSVLSDNTIESNIRYRTVVAIGLVGISSATLGILQELTGIAEDSNVRHQNAIKVLEWISNALEELRKVLCGDADSDVRRYAAEALGLLISSEVAQQLPSLRDIVTDDAHRKANKALEEIDKAVQDLLSILPTNIGSTLRKEAVRALGRMRNENVKEGLMQAFRDENDPAVKAAIAEELYKMENEGI
jgi:HEAT repeat protein